jgi:hypothetical protein
MDLYLTGNYSRYVQYHPFTRRIKKEDIGKKIMVVRPKFLPNGSSDFSFLGETHEVKDVKPDHSIVLSNGTKLSPVYNKGLIVVLDEAKEAKIQETIDESHITDLRTMEKGRNIGMKSQTHFMDVVMGKRIKECNTCFRQNSRYKCCHVFYCSKECQKEDWPEHRLFCSKRRPTETKDSGGIAFSTPHSMLPASMHQMMRSFDFVRDTHLDVHI